MTDCFECEHGLMVYVLSRDCCRARWLSTCYKAHGDAMLDRWQKKDAVMIGDAKAKLKRKTVIAMAKKLKDEKGSKR